MTQGQLVMESPVGTLLLRANETALTEVRFDADAAHDTDVSATLREAETQLREYFAGERHSFDLVLEPSGTDFQRRVWTELEAIPYGKTASYGEIATRLDLPVSASRAVGLANGANPIPIVVPCHRVIGADGSLTGYAGGLERKRTLLSLESAREDTLF